MLSYIIRWCSCVDGIIRHEFAFGANCSTNDVIENDCYRPEQQGGYQIRSMLHLAKHTLVHPMLKAQ